MTGRSVLFLGGTGIISSACTQRAVERGMEVSLLNRGHSTSRPVPEGCQILVADLSDPHSVREAVGNREFYAVADFRAFTPSDVQSRLDVFGGRMGQYVFISSASAYQTPPGRLPVTIVGPSHTYDKTLLPFDGGWTVVDRMRRGVPVVVHGDGTSLWTLTHATDFARAFVGLLGHPAAIGDSFHITSDEWLPWNEIFTIVGDAAGVEPRLVHIPSEDIATADPKWGAGLLGDKAHSMIFDNSKVRRLVPDYVAVVGFHQGAAEIVEWYDADPSRQGVNPAMDATMDQLVAAHRRP